MLNLIFFAESDILDCDTATVCDLLKFSEPIVFTMLSRSARAETRQSRKEDIKRVMHSVDKVIIHTETIINFNVQITCFWKRNGSGVTYLVECLKSNFATGTSLGKAMDTDPRHNDEAIQMDASVSTDQNEDQE